MPETPPSPALTTLDALEGVGPTRAKYLRELGISAPVDLLTYFPHRYETRLGLQPIARLIPDNATVQTATGTIVATNYRPGPKPRFEATLDDGSAKLGLTFFNGAYLRTRLTPGTPVQVTGKVRAFRNIATMANPKWKLIDEADALSNNADDSAPSSSTPSSSSPPAPLPPASSPPAFTPDATSSLVSIYPSSSRIGSHKIATIIQDNLTALTATVHEIFPPHLVKQRRLLDRRTAFHHIHAPTTLNQARAARRRLVYDELMLMQLGLMLARASSDHRLTAPVLRCDKTLDTRIRARFPFALTEAQERVVFDVLRDLSSGRPMNRLIQGDVGSGKTVVALHAMLVAVANKMQATILAPTEVLAEQHFLTISRFLAGSQVNVGLFTSRTRRTTKGANLAALAAGRIHIAVGTQALLQQDVEFANLGLVVVDEQHRLGVRQRGTLRDKAGGQPHCLTMTATPIPRTLALSYFADFDLSVIDSLPPGRQPIETRIVPANHLTSAWEFVKNQIAKGRQAYIVVPQIDSNGDEPSEATAANITDAYAKLTTTALPNLRIAQLHGQLATDDKQAVMQQFRDGHADVLLATTVIEVGVDVPNATVMVILDADRFGLSQLHQLRGRVGRGQHASYCLLVSSAPANSPGAASPSDANTRLQAMAATTSGFEIAEIDLKLRGPGQFFGTRQHGLPEFKLADLAEETELLLTARDDAQSLLQSDPTLHDHPDLRVALRQQFADRLPLAAIG